MDWQESDQNDQVDAIDLTFSSSEPESRPRVTLNQQRLPTVKLDGPSNGKRAKLDGATSGVPSRNTPLHTRQINPQHLTQIIDTAPESALKSVLKELCKLSPALSGAVARGLATQSLFARDLIRQEELTKEQHQRPRAAVTSTLADQQYGQDAREEMKQRLAARSMESKIKNSSARPSTTSSKARVVPSGSQSITKIKREHPAITTESDSDLDQYIPTEFSSKLQAARRTPLPHRKSPKFNTASVSKLLPESKRPTIAKRSVSNETESSTCTQCQMLLDEDDEDGLCFYHAGEKLKVGGVSTCGQCRKPWSSTSCAIGSHVVKRGS